MITYRRPALAVIALVVGALAVAQLPASGHTASFNSSVSMTVGYGFFHGEVGSPLAACRKDRMVRLFKVVDGTDPLIKSTTTNSAGEWAMFRAYEEARFYVKVPARTIQPSGHSHTCKATTSTPLSAWPRVTPRTLHGWTVAYFDCLEWKANPGGAAPLGSLVGVDGPGTPPVGFGSLQLLHQEATSNYSRSDAQWDGLDGQPLSSFRSISFSTYIEDDSAPPNYPPPSVHLHVDVDGNGGGTTTHDLTFTPSISAVVPGLWQKWTAGQSTTWDTPAGDMTLSAYQAAHPSAEFLVFPHGVQLLRECPDELPAPPQDAQFMDAVVVRLTGETLGFDFEP